MAEYLKIGRHDTDYDMVRLLEYRMEHERGIQNPIPFLRATLDLSGDTRRIDMGDPITLRDDMGHIFTGTVEVANSFPENNAVEILARGPLAIPAAWPLPVIMEGDSIAEYLEAWAAEILAPLDLHDEVVIDVTEPPAVPAIIETGGSALAPIQFLRRFAAIHAELVEDDKGRRVLTFTDERTADTWMEGDGAHEFAVPLPVSRERRSPITSVIIKDEGGDTLARAGPPGPAHVVEVPMMLGDVDAYAALCHQALRWTYTAGWCKVMNRGYRTPNVPVKVTDPRGTRAAAVETIIMIGGSEKQDNTTIIYCDRVAPVYVPGAMPGGANSILRPESRRSPWYYRRLRDALNPL